MVISFTEVVTQIADHFPQFFIIEKAGITNKTYYKHDYSKFDDEWFLTDFTNLNLEYVNDSQIDVNSKFNRFLDEIVRNHAPLKKLAKRDLKLRNKPWINSRIQKMMRPRDNILKS